MIYHDYIFFSTHSFSSLPSQKQKRLRTIFLKTLLDEKEAIIYPYATLGLKTNTIFMLWVQASSLEAIQEFLNKLLHTEIGQYLKITYTLFGMVRNTQYSSVSAKESITTRKGGMYLIIYPFTKTYEWYKLSFEKRKELMKGHIAIGRQYPQITQLLLYSYGVDDQEFIVSYETDDLSDFQRLVLELRSDKVRAYTLNDTPIFTCVYKIPEALIEFL